MKIHLIGAYYGYSYCVNKALERAARALGHSIQITDPASSQRRGEDFRVEVLNSNADLLLCTSIEGWHRAFVDIDLPTKVLWLREEIRRPLIKAYVEEVQSFYNHIFYFDQSSFSHFRNQPHYLPLAFDPMVHHKVKTKKDLAITFIGSTENKEGDIYKNRLYALDQIQKAGLPLAVIKTWDPLEASQIYSRSHIVWNLGSYWEESGPVESLRGFGYQNRVFEGLASGALVFTHKVKEGRLFHNRQHLVEYDGDSMIGQLREFSEDKKKAEEIAECGYSFARRNHTYRHRLQELLEVIKK